MLFAQDIGIDLGTANTVVYLKGKGIVIREPSVVAVNEKTDPPTVVAVGNEAKAMIGRTPGSISAVRPLKNGVIADFEITSEMLKEFIKKAIKRSPFSRARVLICVPSGITEVERKAVHDAARNAGAKYASLIQEPLAAAMGAGLPVTEAQVKQLLTVGKTDVIEGFVARTGMKFDAPLKLTEDGQVTFDFPEKPKPVDSNVACPRCKKKMQKGQWQYECECGFKLWHTVAKVELSEEIIIELLTTGKTKKKVVGFTSKAGNVFDTCLKYEDETIKFDFENPGEEEEKKDNQLDLSNPDSMMIELPPVPEELLSEVAEDSSEQQN